MSLLTEGNLTSARRLGNERICAQSVVRTGDLALNLDAKVVEVNGFQVHLTSKEYQMLELLSLRKGTTLTKEMFLNHLYGGKDEPKLNTIDVFVGKLRKKLSNASDGKNYIETVWGRGFVLVDPGAEADPMFFANDDMATPKWTRGPDGSILTLADLPSRKTKRWVIKRKAEVVAAVRGGLLRLEEACARYQLTVKEFHSWERSIDEYGLAGLRVTRLRQYRANIAISQ